MNHKYSTFNPNIISSKQGVGSPFGKNLHGLLMLLDFFINEFLVMEMALVFGMTFGLVIVLKNSVLGSF